MNELLIYIAVFICIYIIDLATALLHRKMKPNNFKRTEANERFRKCIENRGVVKGIGVYIILSLTETIILFIAVLIAANIIFDSTFVMGLMFIFLLLAMIHGLGTLTNLIALCRKEILPKTPMMNVNNMNSYVNMPDKKIKQEIEQDVPKQEIIEDFEDINIETYNRDITKQIKQKPRTEQPKSEEVKMPNKVKRNVPYEYNGGIVYLRK